MQTKRFIQKVPIIYIFEASEIFQRNEGNETQDLAADANASALKTIELREELDCHVWS